ncbi:hypothetical protein OUZ56_008213 [Daphnia magna]|uniref:Uncharacterized protein n=1 Tax=Daphnia magna TaxID=35525 RepID=A0ABR0ACQ1_9CRUS|nr:hypothetical protein OUZ56_008213 [Daphnia magna]
MERGTKETERKHHLGAIGDGFKRLLQTGCSLCLITYDANRELRDTSYTHTSLRANSVFAVDAEFVWYFIL